MNAEIIALNHDLCDMENQESQIETSEYKLTKKQKQIVEASSEISSTNVIESNELGFGARCLVAACLPYRNPKEDSLVNGCWVRTNGNYTLSVQGGEEGIPYGSYPRLFTIWLTTEATRTKSRYITLDRSFKAFCKLLDIDSSRGRNGAGRRLIEQVEKFLSSRISFTNKKEDSKSRKFMSFSDEYHMFWDHDPERILKEANIVLTEAFFKEITTHHIPIDMRAVHQLKNSAQALDIYQWLASRMYMLNHSSKKSTKPSWKDLNDQFGGNYKSVRQFKAEFIKTLKLVHTVYSEAKIDVQKDGLLLMASPTPVPDLKLIKS